MHPEAEARECIAESLKIGERDQLDREVARAQVFAILALAQAVENLGSDLRVAANDIATEIGAA